MKRTFFLCFVSATLGAIVAVVAVNAPTLLPSTHAQEPGRPVGLAPSPALPARPAAPAVVDELTPEERVNVAVYESCNRSAVNITTQVIRPDRFFGFDAGVPGKGEGSGTVIDRQGHVLTNYHVVDGAQNIQVTLYDGSTYEATLVGGDLVTDVAVLKIDAPAASLVPVTFGQSTGLHVGQRVYAIGNPFGFERTLTTGIISSLNRTLPARRGNRKIKSLIQIDAAINPGNSGGPLLDSRGRMIGMNTAIASRIGESAGIGFAIPVNTIARIVPQLIEQGRIIRADLGIVTVFQTPEGLRIRSLVPGGPADKAGLRGPQVIRRRRQQGNVIYEYRTLDRTAADLLVAVDGRKISDAEMLLDYVEGKKPGDRITLTVVRSGRRVDMPVVLESDEE
ncbi:MAG: trypsin-like peptidase domain-containing protein [Pirellulales bacterium]|nr:trypsin-like peptidase domain-containing protein [Pirellulales bacterium]